MSFLSINNVSFKYKNIPVIKNFSLDVEEGSFTTLLGSSGCGKTTLLRLISGFLEPDEGTISINGKVMNGVLPNKRKVGMVFQDYALFPHLTVEQNLGYGLKLSKEPKYSKEQIKKLVLEAAETLGIQELLDRYPAELSGGQQQRVALGRALVLKPNLLLMDEPLSSLDTKLRIKVREELKEIQKNLGITTIYVTHDQEEALSLSNKIAVINQGTLVQYGTPMEVYFKPTDKFVAELVGQSNFVIIRNKNIEETFLVRPEWINLTKNSIIISKYKGIITAKEFFGSNTRFKVQIEKTDNVPAQIITVNQTTVSAESMNIGDKVGISASYKFKMN